MIREVNPPKSESAKEPSTFALADAMKQSKAEKKIPVVELFGPTIEGEGKLIGTQTFFIRFGLCDYKCRKCDSMHAVDPNLVKALASYKTQQEIFEALVNHAASKSAAHIRNVTFSGGNPAIHDLSELVHLLKEDGWNIFVETQGTKCPLWFWEVDEIVCSPKSPGMGEVFEQKVFEEFVQSVAEYNTNLSIKIVVFNQLDLEFAAHVFDIARVAWAAGYGDYTGDAALDWMHYNCFLSLGNPYPPQFEFTGELDPSTGKLQVGQGFDYPEFEAENKSEETTKNTLAGVLLNQYNTLCEAIMLDPRLSFAKFLPQLHVLVYGNEAGR